MTATTNGTAPTPTTATTSGTTKLYLHECPRRACPSRWSKFPNLEEDQKNLQETTALDPIVHRHTFADNKWSTQSFTIQSPFMRDHLRVALAKYQDFDADLENWTFKPPFNPIVHRWDRLNVLCDETGEDQKDSKKAIIQLMDFLRPILAPSVEALARTKATGKVSFDDIWQIFPPSEIVMTSFFGVEAVCRVTKYEKVEPPYEDPYWVISLEYLDWNGHSCGYANTKVVIKLFKGFRHVVSLPVYPLSFNKSESDIKERIVDRGRKFESLRGYHFQTCFGTKILLETKCPEERPVAGRIVVDAYAYYLNNNKVRPQLTSLSDEDRKGKSSDDSNSDVDIDDDDEDLYEDGQTVPSNETTQEGPEMTAAKSLNAGRVEVLDALTDEQCLLATPWVRGLDLKTKEWAQFCVDDISPIIWNDTAFNHLVLPGNEKQLAWSFVENKALATNKFDDFVQDKGRGIIILMFGPPGVGKTYTAEAVAERARVPLYSMSAGTLGTVPKEVESALERALDLCKLWNAMLLLDEADVFLGARTNVDLARNELVAVFLTKLEYYQGICFLTTNRMASLDRAFQSRVDLFLPYHNLTVSARREVWANFINRAGASKFDVSDADLDKLAEVKLNGREIKNLIKSAHLLSLKGAEKINMERLSMLASNRMTALTALKEEEEA